jgi:hypothetical protein
MSEAANEVADEVELLRSIYPDSVEATVDARSGATVVRVSVTPRADRSVANVRASVILRIAGNGAYPNEPCTCDVDVAKGIDAAPLQQALRDTAARLRGTAMLYDVVECAIELVTSTNAHGPAASCSICMCEIERAELWLRTRCEHFFHVDCLCEWYQQQRTAYQDKRKALAQFHADELRKLAPFALLCPDCRSVVDDESRRTLRLKVGDSADELEPWMRAELKQAAALRAAADAALLDAERRAAAERQRVLDEEAAELAAIVTPCVLAEPVPLNLLEPLRHALVQRFHAVSVRAAKHPATRAHTGLAVITFETDAGAEAFLKSKSQVRFDRPVWFARVDLGVIRRHAPSLDFLIELYNLPVEQPNALADTAAAVAAATAAAGGAPAPSELAPKQQDRQQQQPDRQVCVLLSNLAPKTTVALLQNALRNYGLQSCTLLADGKRAVVRFGGDESSAQILKQIAVVCVLDRVLQPSAIAEPDALELVASAAAPTTKKV